MLDCIYKALACICEQLKIFNSKDLTGPQGPAGAAGQDGQDGQDGATGAQGPAGQDGQDGQDGSDATVSFCNTTPIADNRADTDLRTGSAGTSNLVVRCDHKHPIRRQSNPGDPTITAAGKGAMTTVQVLDRHSDEESYSYKMSCLTSQNTGIGWFFLTIPGKAGFQTPKISGIGNYRNSSNSPQIDATQGQGGDGAGPRGPYMGKEFHEYRSTQRLYWGFYRQDEVIPSNWVDFWIKYTRV